MPRIDDRLRVGLTRAARPADPAGVFEHLGDRRARRSRARRARAGIVAVAIATATATWAVVATAPLDDRDRSGGGAPYGSAGFVATCGDAFGTHLCRVRGGTLENGIEATDLIRLTNEELEVVSTPSVSPGGTRIVFDRFDPVADASTLWIVGVNGSGLRRLSRPDSGLMNASWGPDGSLVAVASVGGSNLDAAFAILDPTRAPAPTLQRITLPGLSFPSAPRFSPDGKSILFHASGTGDRAGTHVYTIRPDGTGLTQRTGTPGARDPEWSPDGDRIAFWGGTPSGMGLYVCPVDCRSPHALVDPSGRRIHDGERPRWTPDGVWITYQVPDDGSVRIVRVDGTEMRTLATRVTDIAWIPQEGAKGADPPRQIGREIGLSFNLCRLQADRGLDLVGSTKPATVWTGFRVVPDRGCIDGSAGDPYLAIDVVGGPSADYHVGPLPCHPGCDVVAAPDMDGDGDQEILVGFFNYLPTAPGRAWVYDVRFSEAGSGPMRYERPDGRPWVVLWGSDGGSAFEAGIGCPSPGTVKLWRARTPDAGYTWDVRTTTFRLDDLVAVPVGSSSGNRIPGNWKEPCGAELIGG